MKKKDYLKYLIPSSLTVFICWYLFSQPEICAGGVKNGILMCAQIVIPSLFPFMVVSSFIIKSGMGDALGKLLNKPTNLIFKLPGICSAVIVMSQIGGFPIGAKMTSELLKSNAISKNQAQRMNLFCLNAGPAFIISTVGSMMLGSTKAGILIYISTVCASLITGILSVSINDKRAELKPEKTVIRLHDPVSSFVDSTASAAKAMLMICAWVVVFRTVCDITANLNISPQFRLFLNCILEVTNGCQSAAGVLPIPAVAAVISFGGLSVHCQINSYVRDSGLKMRYFYTARLICASVSAIICMELLKVFPCEIETFATNPNITATAYSISVPACAALLIMSALLIFEVDTTKKVC